MLSSEHDNLQLAGPTPSRPEAHIRRFIGDEGSPRCAHSDVILTFQMGVGRTFDMHHHHTYQLVWSPDGILNAHTATQSWVLSPNNALWIPPYVEHNVSVSGPTLLRSLYLTESAELKGLEQITQPVTITVDDLLRSVINRLAGRGTESAVLDATPRDHLETVLFDCLRASPQDNAAIALPIDDRARQVALAVMDDPSNQRTLAEWGVATGASARTLSRLFRSQTGSTFDGWRRDVRMHTAMSLLLSGSSVENCARSVGYGSSSTLGAVFRQTFGMTPGEAHR